MVQLNRTIFLILSAICFQFTKALHCKIGWPVILGADNWDGDTEVTTWSKTPTEDKFFVGGRSNSLAFTE